MIKEISIKNFQSHKNSTLVLSEGLNIICGTSDSGKSAIKRSIEWAIKNRPSGDSIRSWWGGKTSVNIVFNNGSVERSKDKIEEYVVNETTKLHAFGLSVPDEVTKVINMTDVNLQNQMDAPFLLSETSGAVASHFNKVAGLDRIDVAQTKVDSWIRLLKSDIASKEKDIEKYQITLEKYSGLEKIEIELEVLEELQTQYLAKKNKIKTFSDLIKDIADTQTEIEQNTIPDYETEVNSLLEKMESYRQLKKDSNTLESLLSTIDGITEQMKESDSIISVESEVLNLLTFQESYKTQNKAIASLNNAIKDIKDILSTIEEKEAKLVLLSATFKKEMPNICPLCNTILKK